jgi:hypothetical protein
LQFTKKELKNNVSPEVNKNLDNLKINPKRVDYYSETGFSSDMNFTVLVKDSICFDTVKCEIFRYKDEFYDVFGIVKGDSVKVKISSTDSIIQVAYKGSRYNKKGKKMPGIFLWLPRRLEQVIMFKNPNYKAVYSKTIVIN